MADVTAKVKVPPPLLEDTTCYRLQYDDEQQDIDQSERHEIEVGTEDEEDSEDEYGDDGRRDDEEQDGSGDEEQDEYDYDAYNEDEEEERDGDVEYELDVGMDVDS